MTVVLSTFDGMSCGQIAFNKMGVKPSKYYAAEIDPYAIKVTQANYPSTIQMGDVTKWREWDLDWSTIDYFIGGSPCQGFSLMGGHGGTLATLNGDTVIISDRVTYQYMKLSGAVFSSQSHLFWEYVLLLDHIQTHNPEVKFLLENVAMAKHNVGLISDALGVEPVLINSTLVSAQGRKRLYWCNWYVEQPVDHGITYTAIVDDPLLKPATVRKGDPRPIYLTGDKFKCLTATYYKGIRADGRPALAVSDGIFENLKIVGHCRQLTPVECERLQTVPDDYTNHVTNTQRYIMLGNGWTVNVIMHILSRSFLK
jgi:site-specific DNA-cytosine methylase